MSFGLVVEKRLVDVQSLARDIREWRPAWLIMLLTDIVALELCVLLGYLTRLMLAPIWPIVIRTDQFAAIALGVLALPVALHFMGTYPGYGVSPILRLRQRAMASFVLFGLLISWNYLQQSAELSRGVLIATMVYALFVPFIIESLVQKLLIRLKLWGQPTVILGAGKTGASLVRLLQRRPELGLIPVGLFDELNNVLLCPCHQSTFDVLNGAERVFGPAPRALPQLPLAVDSNGYLIAQDDYDEPIGPSFWNRLL